MAILGKPINRVDGLLKVTGKAIYAAEYKPAGMVYAFPIRSTIANGTIEKWDTAAAEKLPGVLTILTNENAPKLRKLDKGLQETGGNLGEKLVSLQDDKIYYYGQYIGLVIADTYEQARTAANMVQVAYKKEKPVISLKKELPNAKTPENEKRQEEESKSNTEKNNATLAAAAIKTDQLYTTPTENHHPMEPHATIAMWEGANQLRLYDATQAVIGQSGIISYLFEIPKENVHVISPYVGGGFGAKGSVWGHVALAAMGAKVVQKPVKLVITRQMMQTNVGRRGETLQTIAMSTDAAGKLTAIKHHTDTYGNLSDFFEPCGKQTKVLYQSPTREVTYKVAKLHVGTPTYMRAPGETPGTFALESAIDEMAHEARIDPLAFRILNHTGNEPMKNLPFSSEYLLDCYKIGAEKIGWSKRSMQPRQMRQGKNLIGYGMATATYPANRSTASARVQMMKDGSVTVMSATQDIGTGTYTILAQTAATVLGIPMKQVTVKIGDSTLPPAPVSGGSQTAASVVPAVVAACKMLRNDLLQMAIADGKSPLKGKRVEDVEFDKGKLFIKGSQAKSDSYSEIMRRNSKPMMEACMTAKPESGRGTKEAPCMLASFEKDENLNKEAFAFHSFGAQFAEVWVDEDFGTIRVKRFVSVHDIGTIMNEKQPVRKSLAG